MFSKNFRIFPNSSEDFRRFSENFKKSKKLVWRPYNKKNITRFPKDMDFIFLWPNHLTRFAALNSWECCRLKIKSISFGNRVISSIYNTIDNKIIVNLNSLLVIRLLFMETVSFQQNAGLPYKYVWHSFTSCIAICRIPRRNQAKGFVVLIWFAGHGPGILRLCRSTFGYWTLWGR